MQLLMWPAVMQQVTVYGKGLDAVVSVRRDSKLRRELHLPREEEHRRD